MTRLAVATAVGVSVVVGGCALRLGGPKPVTYLAAAVDIGAGSTAQEVATRLSDAGARVVILAADRDSTWFADVAAATGRNLSGPGRARSTSFAFLADEALGDTTLWLRTDTGDSIPVHDALYQVDESRFLDLLAVEIPASVDVREAVRSLLRYVATDVMPNAAVLLGVLAPPASADSLATLLQPIFADASDCGDVTAAPGMSLFYGPTARLECRGARSIAGDPPGLFARFTVTR